MVGRCVERVVIYSAATDVNHLLGRPGQYVAKVSWSDSRDHADGTSAGTIEFFSSASDLLTRERYVKSVEKGSPLLGQYIYVDRLALMRLGFALTPSAAAKYQAVFEEDRARGLGSIEQKRGTAQDDCGCSSLGRCTLKGTRHLDASDTRVTLRVVWNRDEVTRRPLRAFFLDLQATTCAIVGCQRG